MLKPIRLVLGLAIVVSLVLSLVLAGCATPTTPAPTSTPAKALAPTQPPAAPAATKAPAAPAAPQAAKVVTILMAQEPDTLMPSIGAMMAKTEVLGAMWTDLVMRDDNNDIIPWGAESVPTLENGGAKFVGEGTDRYLELTYKIRKDLKWHDGVPVTSQDVKFTIELMQNPDFPAQQRDLPLRIADVLTPDDKTAVVKFMSEKQAHQAAAEGWKFQNADFYQGYDKQVGPVVHPEYYLAGDGIDHIVPAHILSKIAPQDIAKSDYARKPVGNGPYKFKDWVPAQTLVVEAAETSLFGKPAIETVVFRIVADATAILNALAAGEAQASTQIGLDIDQSPELDKLEQEGKIKAHYIPASAWEHLDFNMLNPIFEDKRVRQAMIYATDRETIVDKVLFGKSVVMHSWIAPPHWAIDEATMKKYEYNPTKAKELLAEAGWTMGSSGFLEKDGKQFKIKLQTTTAKIRQTVAPLIQANFKDVGINLEVEYLPGRGLFETEGPLMTHTFDTALYTWISPPDPDPIALYHSKNCPDGANYPCWKNAEADELMLKASSEISQEKRKPLYSQLLRIWTDDLPTIPIFQRLAVSAASPKLENFKPTPSTTPETWNIHEWFMPAN